MPSHALTRSLFSALAAASLLTLSACGHKPRAAHITLKSSDRTVTVIGRSEVSSKPDIARANVGVEVISPTVDEAMKQARTRMTNLIAALKRVGIADKDIRTSNFSIYFERDYAPAPPMPIPMPMLNEAAGQAPAPVVPAPKGAPKGATRGAAPAPVPPPPPAAAAPMIAPPPQQARSGVYHVNNMVEVVIRDLEKVGPVLDAATAAGANNVGGVSFSIDETTAVEAKARELAVADAKKRAEALAKLSGVALGPVVSVSEVVGFSGPPGPMPMAARAAGSMDQTPVSHGELQYSAQLQVVYTIVPVATKAPEDAGDE